MVEIEASHRVDKQAKALQSELTFKDHQLTVAQKDHSSAIRELNAERAKRRREAELAVRDREEAVAAASTAAAAAAAEAATTQSMPVDSGHVDGSPDGAGSGGVTEGSRTRVTGGREQHGEPEEMALALFTAPTLAEVLLSELSDEIMVLLSAGASSGAGNRRRCRSSSSSPAASGDEWDGDDGGEEDRSGGESDHGDESGRDLSWFHSPPRGGGDSSGEGPGSPRTPPPFGHDPVSVSPKRLPPWEQRLGEAEDAARRGDDVDGALRLESGHGVDEDGCEGQGADGVSPGDGLYEDGSGEISPYGGGFWGAEGDEGGDSDGSRSGSDDDGADGDDDGDEAGDAEGVLEWDERLEEELRELSSQMLSCTVGLLEGQASAGDLLDVLAGFLEALPGDSVSQGKG